MDNPEQGRDGQPLADHILLRPDVDPFLPQRASLVNGLSNLTNTVDGISNRLDVLSDQVSSLHKQVLNTILELWKSIWTLTQFVLICGTYQCLSILSSRPKW